MASARRTAAPQTATSAHRSTPARFAPTQIGPTARASRSGRRLALRWRGSGLGDHTIAGRSTWCFLSPSRRLLLGVGPESYPRRNNSEHGNQKQRRDRAGYGTPPFTQVMDVTTEGAARQCGRALAKQDFGAHLVALRAPRCGPASDRHGARTGVASVAHAASPGEPRLFLSCSNMLFACVDAAPSKRELSGSAAAASAVRSRVRG
jgi:hypothetical protein